MRFLNLLTIGSVAVLLTWGSVGAQQTPNSQSLQNPNTSTQSPSTESPATPANPTSTENPSVSSSSASTHQNMGGQKEKHWTGSLVDVKCLAKTLGSGAQSEAPAPAAPNAQTPHYTSANPDQLQQSGQTGGAAPIGPAGANRAGTPSTYPGQDSGQNPDMSQTQSAQASAAAQRMDVATKQCAASNSTETFGLALSNGKVVQLDNDGNSKASQALRAVDLPPGKKVKAKVTGVEESDNMLRVASVEIKGKKASPSSSMSGAAGEVK